MNDPQQDFYQRRLTGTIRAEQTEYLAAMNV
jgi:hypothetical protein